VETNAAVRPVRSISRGRAIGQYMLFNLKRRLRRRPMEIAMLLYPGMTALDLVGPHEVLSRIPGARVRRVAEVSGPIVTDSDLILTAEEDLSAVTRADILFVPGASDAWPVTRSAATLDWLQRIDATTTWTTSVCTGALILGAAGLLKGHHATTFWSERETLRDFGAEPVNARVVESGKVMTGAGVSAGIDLALTLVDRIAGRLVAQGLQLGIEYDPAPPFEGGSPAKTPGAIVQKVRERIEEASTRGQADLVG
jgi:transcriptional regulator GlxA family with amidase domain